MIQSPLSTLNQKFQSDSITIVDIEPEAQKFQRRVDRLNGSSLLGGWEEAFKQKFDEESNTFCGIQIWEKERRRPGVDLYLTDRRQFSAFRNECIAAIKEFIDKRLQVDTNA